MHPSSLSDVWFQHHSPTELTVIRPQTYASVLAQRGTSMDRNDADRYTDDRTYEEDAYRTALGLTDDDVSFTYATVVGFNKMEDPTRYPGFTYFFRLSPARASSTLFGIVANEGLGTEPQKGIRALERCLNAWVRGSHLMIAVNDPIVGIIDPRVEVIIPFDVRPELFIPQVEDR